MKVQLAKLLAGQALDEDEAAGAMDVIMDGEATSAQIGALLAALLVRGETEDEVVGFARAMRARATPIASQTALDTCGTGGDGARTFNISTLVSLVVAACGVVVAKHGNRSSSGGWGSADLLEALELRIDAPVDVVQRCLDRTGWTFMFAPAFHAATRHAVAPRRELGVRTAFNLLGPLTNPARPVAQLVGVPRPELAPFLARCLGRLGVKRAWVVHGAGLDELSPCGPNVVAELIEGRVREFELDPEAVGFARTSRASLVATDGPACLAAARSVLADEPGPLRDAVLLNAGAALLVAGRTDSVASGAATAGEALTSGAVGELLAKVREALAS